MTVEVLFECSAAAEAPSDEGDPSQALATTRSRLRVLERESALAFESFQLAFATVSGKRSSMEADPATWVYPSVRVSLTIAGVEEQFQQDVTFDGSLFAQMVGLYTGFGWMGIEAVRDAATFQFSPTAGAASPSAVSDIDLQAAVSEYAQRTIQAVANLVYDSLVYLEQCLKKRAIESLTLVSGCVNEAFKTLQIQQVQVSTRPTFKFANKDAALEKEIHFALTRFSKAYRSRLDMVSRTAMLKNQIREIPVEAALNALLSDVALPDSDEASIAKTLDKARRELAKVETQKERDTKIVEGLSAGIASYFPAAVPVCLWIGPGDNVTTVTNKLGQFYWELGRRTDRLKAQIPIESMFVHKTARRAVYRQADVIENVAYKVPPGGLEVLVAQRALTSRDASIDAQVLSDVDAIEMVLGSDALPPGSVEYAVGCHYLHVLYALIVQREAERAAAEANMRTASTFSSALSLLSLIPELRVLDAVATVIDRVLLAAFFVRSADLLQELELDLDQAVLRKTTATFGGLSEFAALVDQRKRMIAELNEEVVKQLGMQIAMKGAGQIKYVRGALAVRSYYMDLENLLAPP